MKLKVVFFMLFPSFLLAPPLKKEKRSSRLQEVCYGKAALAAVDYKVHKAKDYREIIEKKVPPRLIKKLVASYQLSTEAFFCLKYSHSSTNLLKEVQNNTTFAPLLEEVPWYNDCKIITELDKERGSLSLYQNNALYQNNEINFGNLSLTSLYGLNEVPCFSAIHTLILSNNKLKTIPSTVFDGAPQLQHLNLSKNEISDLPENVFAKLTHLKTLFLSHNNLTMLPIKIFDHCTELQVLNLNSNKLQSISPRHLIALSSLEKLLLAFNKLKILPKGLFTMYKRSSSYYEEGHQEQHIPDSEKIIILNNLKMLNVSCNSIKKFPFTTVTSLPHLRFLNAFGNPCSRGIKKRKFLKFNKKMRK